MKAPNLKIGDKLKFRQMKRPFPVVACNEHFAICAYRLTGVLSKYNFVYTIVDWKREIRGPDNYYTKHDYLNAEESSKALRELGDGRGMYKRLCKEPGKYYRKFVWHDPELEISHRRKMELDLESIIRP